METNELVEQWLSDVKVSENTEKLYRFKVTRFFRDTGKRAEEVTREDIDAYLRDQQQGGSTKNLTLCCLRSFFWYAEKAGIVSENPARYSDWYPKDAAMEKPFTEEEIAALDEVIRGDPGHGISALEVPRNYAIFRVFLSTGCSVSEVCMMKRSDISGKSIMVTALDGKRRKVYLTEECAAALQEYLCLRGDDFDALFTRIALPTPDGCQQAALSRFAAEKQFRKYGKTAEVENFATVRFRHTFIARAEKAGMPPAHVRAIVGYTPRGHAGRPGWSGEYCRDEDVEQSFREYIDRKG